MKFIASVLVFVSALAIVAPAQAQPIDRTGSRILTSIDDQTLRLAIDEVGGVVAPLDDKENTLRIIYPNAMRAIARRMACVKDQGCKGLILLAYFSKPEGVSEAQQQAALTRFGLEQNLASVVVNREGEHVVKSYIIFDGGITLANLVVRIALFAKSAKTYQGMLYGAEDES
jgi:hypothetical protein